MWLIYSQREEVHGLYVVSKGQLKKDVQELGDATLATEGADIIG